MKKEEVTKWLTIMKANLNSFPEVSNAKKIEALREAIRLLKNEQSIDKVDCDHTECRNCINHKYCDYESSSSGFPNKSEKPISSDCVDRHSVDMLAYRYLREATDNHVAFYEDFLDLPSVTPQELRWILVSERLPEDRELVLCSSKRGGVFEGRYFDDETDCQWYAFRNDEFVRNDVIDAWMPLPKVYKAEREDI